MIDLNIKEMTKHACLTQSTTDYNSKAVIARMLEAMHGHTYQKHWDRSHLNPTALRGYHCY